MKTLIAVMFAGIAATSFSPFAVGEEPVRVEQKSLTPERQPVNVVTATSSPAAVQIAKIETGTLTGRILVRGPRPKPKLIDYPRAEMEEWKRDGYSGQSRHRPSHHQIFFDNHFRGQGVTEQALLVSDAGGLANVFVTIQFSNDDKSAVPRWKSEPPLPAARIAFVDGQLEPRALIVQPGTPLEIVNRTEAATIDIQAGEAVGSMLIPAGKTVSIPALPISDPRKPPRPQRLRSNFAPWLASYVLVLPHPCGGISNGAGEFRIDGIPPGECEITLWHEQVGWLKSDLFPKGRDRISIAAGVTSLGDLHVAENIFPAQK